MCDWHKSLILKTLALKVISSARELVSGRLALLLLPLLYLCTTPDAYSQHTKIDSLLVLVENDKPDTILANHLHLLGLLYAREHKFDSALQMGSRAIAVAEKLNDRNRLAEALNDVGTVYFNQHKYPASLASYQRALRANTGYDIGSLIRSALICNNIGMVYEKEGAYAQARDYYVKAVRLITGSGDKKMQAYMLNSIGDFYWIQGNEPKSLKYFSDAIKLNTETGDNTELARGYNNIGVLYYSENNFPQALSNYTKALSFAGKAGDSRLKANILSNIGSIYREKGDINRQLSYSLKSLHAAAGLRSPPLLMTLLGNVGLAYWKKSDYSEALKYYSEALAYADSLGDKPAGSVIADNMGVICESQGDYPKALEYEFLSLNYSTRIGDLEGMAISKNKIGEIYSKQKNVKEAENYILQALYLADSVHLLQTIENSALDLSTLFAQKGEWGKAYHTYLQYVSAKDKLEAKDHGNALLQAQSAEEHHIESIIQKMEDDKEMVLMGLSGKGRWVKIASALILLLALVIIFLLQINIYSLTHKAEGDKAQNGYFILYMPHSVESGIFCRGERWQDTTLLMYGNPDVLHMSAQGKILQKNYLNLPDADPEIILKKIRESVNWNSIDNKMDDKNNITLLVANHKLSKICWEGSDLSMWLIGKKKFFKITPDKTNSHLTKNDRRLYTLQAAKGDVLYTFSKGWQIRLGTASPNGANTLLQKIKEVFNLDPETQRSKFRELIEEHLQNTPQTEDLLLTGLIV
jgi:tetratricopeptide (TPR) repeat protein